jgi:hypothetical protein
MGRTPGFSLSEEQKKQLSESHKGKHHSEETKKKISVANKGENNYLFGKHLSEETKNKISRANSGINHPLFGTHRSEETKRKQSISCSHPKSVPRTEEHKRKIGLKNKGEKSGNWKGGISYEPYCPLFNEEFKERVRAYFGYQCQMCGHIWQEGEIKLTVHHVNYRKNSCCDPEIKPLFVPVCSGSCHGKTNYHRAFWEDWFTEIINEFYGGKCYIPKTNAI